MTSVTIWPADSQPPTMVECDEATLSLGGTVSYDDLDPIALDELRVATETWLVECASHAQRQCMAIHRAQMRLATPAALVEAA